MEMKELLDGLSSNLGIDSLAIIGGISCQKFKSADVVFESGHAHAAGGKRSYAVIKIFNDFGVQ